jgi:hypothetical protein
MAPLSSSGHALSPWSGAALPYTSPLLPKAGPCPVPRRICYRSKMPQWTRDSLIAGSRKALPRQQCQSGSLPPAPVEVGRSTRGAPRNGAGNGAVSYWPARKDDHERIRPQAALVGQKRPVRALNVCRAWRRPAAAKTTALGAAALSAAPRANRLR